MSRERKITMSNFNSSVKSASATYFTFDHIRKTINGSEFNFKMSGNPNKPQYEALMTAMAMHPNYTLTPIESTKKDTKKQTYKGLNLELTSFYISQKGDKVAKAEFDHMVEDKKISYPTIKSWFLEQYPTIEIAKTQRAMAQKDLADRKAAVRTAVKVKMVKAEEAKASTIALASNF